VQHFVYGSVGGAERKTGVPHFESKWKWKVEEHIRRIGLPARIVRPVFYMENLSSRFIRVLQLALMRSYIPSGKTLQMIALDDVGAWVARAFADPKAFIGKAEEIAGDELTTAEIIDELRRRGLGAGLPFSFPQIFFGALPHDIRKMFEWFGSHGYEADIRTLKRQQPSLMTFRDWLARPRVA